MGRPKKTDGDEVAARLSAKTPRVEPPDPRDMLSTGSTLMNLAFSGRPDVGVPKGTYWYHVGDTGTSKSWGLMTLFAEATRNPVFRDYRLVFDNAENGMMMDVARYFGRAVVDRLVPPATAGKSPRYSATVQEFYYHLESNVRRGPCVYALDSMDALNDDADEAKFEAELHHHETGKGEVPGSMGMAKAKTNSKNINRVAQTLRTNGSILVIVGQTRDKIGTRFPTKTRGGGHALQFYCHLMTWLKPAGELTRRYHGRDRVYGDLIRAEVHKNRVCGWEGVFETPFIKGHGIDEVGGMVRFLLDERHWKYVRRERGAADKDSGKDSNKDSDKDSDDTDRPFEAPEFAFVGTAEQLVAKIDGTPEESELRRIVAAVWRDIRDHTAPPRKPRY